MHPLRNTTYICNTTTNLQLHSGHLALGLEVHRSSNFQHTAILCAVLEQRFATTFKVLALLVSPEVTGSDQRLAYQPFEVSLISGQLLQYK